jgi:hypothetical protein
MYRVIKAFVDLQDGNHKYNVGDIYPRENVIQTPARLEKLAGVKNRQGVPLIEYFEPDIIPAQSNEVEQEAPLEEDIKPKRNRKHKEE